MVNRESVTKETFRTELERLVRNFAANEDELTAPGYTEMQARTQFITPFFRALGWDVENRAAKSYREMEVLEERGPGEGRPDYTFRIGGSAKFFVEAKAPHEDLENERHVLQAKRYAWSTKEVFAVVLTDFEEFRFYDASLEPNPDHPHRGQLLDLTYRQYLDNIGKLWELSRERVAAGSIEALLPRDKRALRHRKPVDDKFLEDMTRWRADLAKAVHKRNPDLDAHALTDIVQRLLDRFIFIRVAEDRRIVEKNTLLDRALDWEAMGGRKPLLPMVNDLFHQINDDFNGDIFKYHRCEEIKLTDQALHRIIKELYPPKSPYRFDVIPVDIFGAVYERYLGKTIHVRGKDVRVEDKPEVRKAGGVYYTPKFIVDYIVKNTVGKVIEGKTPKQAEKIKILDPACGSGSFLLGAFQYLIDYHVAYYEKHPKQARVHPLYPDLVKSNGVPRLSIWRKAKILHNNLFGVDLDPQAVEITMMNLYLKALEQERDLPQKQHLLPELGRNIRCGNSLIAPDITKQQELSPEELDRLKPFDWYSKTDGFGEILAAAEGPERSRGSGFDAVIGNPPYVRTARLGMEKEYYSKTFESAYGAYDIYVLFIERAVQLARKHGRVGLITPNKYFVADYAKALRNLLFRDTALIEIADFGKCKSLFRGAMISTVVSILERGSQDSRPVGLLVLADEELDQLLKLKSRESNLEQIISITDGTIQIYRTPEAKLILEKLGSGSTPLEDLATVRTGVMGFDYWAMNKCISDKNRGSLIATNSYVDRYEFLWGKRVKLYGREFRRPRLNPRCKVINKQTLEFFRTSKIVVRGVARRVTAVLDSEGVGLLVAVHGIIPFEKANLRYLLGLINSNLFNWVHHTTFYSARIPQGSLRYPVSFFSKLPIRIVDSLDTKARHLKQKLILLIDVMCELVPQSRNAKSPRERETLASRISATDVQINRLVYQLYGLTPEEIALVEQGFKEKESS